MDSFFENLDDILGSLPDNRLAIVSLVVVAVGLLALVFFAREQVWARLVSFVLCFVGATGIVVSLLNTKDPGGVQNSQEITPATAEPPPAALPEPSKADCNNLEEIDFGTWMKQCNEN